jgi:hypothetical protein
MTASSRDGRDKPFNDWLRKHPNLESYIQKLYSCDIDQVFLKYETNVDNLGTRDVKLMLEVEIKSYGKKPDNEQLETLFFRHQLLNTKNKYYSNLLRRKISLWHFGQYVLIIHGGNRPDNCLKLQWGIFNKNGDIKYYNISERHLITILSFRYRPDKYEPTLLSLRRHHKTTQLMYTETRDLLFPVEKTLIKRS